MSRWVCSKPGRLRAALFPVFTVSLFALVSLASRSRADGTVDAGAAGQVISPAHPTVTVPVTLARDDATPLLGFHVRVSISAELAVSGGASGITEGSYLDNGGVPTSYQVIDLGGGNYVVDGVVLGSNNCRTEASGTLFSLLLARHDGSILSGPGTVTIVSDTLRDCSNAVIASSPGTASSVDIDYQPPAIAVGAPNGGESWASGSVQSLTWSASDASGIAANGVDLDLSSDGGATWVSIASAQPNSGSFPWTVPAIATTNGRVRVTARDVYGNSAADESDASFTIAVGTSAALGSSANPSVLGASVTLSASITPASATGSVEFLDGASSLGTAPAAGGTASLDIAGLAIGTHSISAAFTGTGGYGNSTSPPLAQEVRAQIVVTFGANGSVAPAGTTTYALGASAPFTITPDAGHHVASLTVDAAAQSVTPGVMTYTFNSIHANHTLDATFAANPGVPPISALAAAQVKTGGDADGTTRIRVSWPDVPAGSTVAVFRAGYGNYPYYDDGPGAGSTPAVPSFPPGAPWTAVTLSELGSFGGTTSGTDETRTRDYYYYVAFVTDGYGTASSVSNMTGGTLNYLLGDVAGGVAAGAGDNEVDIADISLLGAHYGISGAAADAVAYLDVGPTTDFSVNGRPTTDHRIDFEDLVMFALDYGTTQGPPTAARPSAAAPAAEGPTRIALEVDDQGAPTIPVHVWLNGAGDAHALSIQLSWNAAAVEPVGIEAGDLPSHQNGVVFSPRAGAFDAALLGAARAGFAGSGVLANVSFRRIGPGDAAISLGTIAGRDGANHAVTIERGAALPAIPTVTSFAGARPNPFRASTELVFGLAKGGAVDLTLFSVDGRRVRTLLHEWREPGEYRLSWDGRSDDGQRAAAGIYFARLDTPQGRFVRRTVRIE